jgi:hypothetical protein
LFFAEREGANKRHRNGVSGGAVLGILAGMPIRILCLGDIVGRPGRRVVEQKLKGLVK